MSPTRADLQTPPEPARLAALADAVHPGASVVAIVPLRGGIDNGMHVLDLRLPSGSRERVVLRRHGSEPLLPPARRAANEFALLQRLEQSGIPAPRPLLDDASGEIAGTPAIVLAYIEGAPVHDPADAPAWHEQVAEALHGLHSIDVAAHALGFLGEPVIRGLGVLARGGAPDRHLAHPLARPLWAAIGRLADTRSEVPLRVIHTDCWPGNMVWHRGVLRAIVDWDQAALGDPAMDVAVLEIELCLAGSPAQAERFAKAYRAASGLALDNLRFYELLALAKPLPDPVRWIGGSEMLAEAGLEAQDLRRDFDRTIEAKLRAL